MNSKIVAKIYKVQEVMINHEVDTFFDDKVDWNDYYGATFETVVDDITDYITGEVLETLELLKDYDKVISEEIVRHEVEKLVAMKTMYYLMYEGYTFNYED